MREGRVGMGFGKRASRHGKGMKGLVLGRVPGKGMKGSGQSTTTDTHRGTGPRSSRALWGEASWCGGAPGTAGTGGTRWRGGSGP